MPPPPNPRPNRRPSRVTVSEEASSEISEPAAPSTPAFDPANLSEDEKLTLSPMAESMGMDPATMTDAEWQRVAEAAAAQMAGGSEEEAVSQPEASVPETPAEEAPSQMEQNLAVLEEMGVDPSQLSEEQLSYLSTMTTDQVREMMASYAAPTENTYEGNLSAFGAIDLDSPAGIEIIPKSFEDKEAITGLISQYNDACTAGGREEDTIDYTDMVGLLMSSVTTIINAISYILIAFVGISLVVSSIMIGIITYISVLERTKEIGILRAIGASKRDISNVFNAETLIIGFTSGAMGIIVTPPAADPGQYGHRPPDRHRGARRPPGGGRGDLGGHQHGPHLHRRAHPVQDGGPEGPGRGAEKRINPKCLAPSRPFG